MPEPTLVIDPLAFELRATGGVSRVWATVLPRLVDSGLNIRFTSGQGGREAMAGGLDDAIAGFARGHTIPAGVRRFIPYGGKADLFFPTYFRPCRRGTRNIQLVHDCLKEMLYPPLKGGLSRLRRGNLYRSADCLISVSEATRLDMYRLYGNSIGDRVRVIHNPVDSQYLSRCVASDTGEEEFSGWLGRIDGRPFALYVGHRPGVKNFVETRHLLAALPEHVLVVIGPAPSVSELTLSADLGGRILYAGPCADGLMFKLLNAAQFLFFPSLSEGFGLPVIESLLLGTPVLALETQINREVSRGLITSFECGSVSSIRVAASSMTPILADHPARKALAAAYDPAAICDQYVQTIQEFL